MARTEIFDDNFTRVRREESKAHNEMDYYERVAKGQQAQMDALLKHKDECVKGIANAKKSGLPPLHVREFKLLMAHIDLTLGTLLYKVEKSQADFEKSQDVWLQKSKIFNEIKEQIKQKALEQGQEFIVAKESESSATNNNPKGTFGYHSI